MSFYFCPTPDVCIPIPVILPPWYNWPTTPPIPWRPPVPDPRVDPTPHGWEPVPWVNASGPRPHPWINDLPIINTISVLIENLADEDIRDRFESLVSDAAGQLAQQLPTGELRLAESVPSDIASD